MVNNSAVFVNIFLMTDGKWYWCVDVEGRMLLDGTKDGYDEALAAVKTAYSP